MFSDEEKNIEFISRSVLKEILSFFRLKGIVKETQIFRNEKRTIE